MGGAYRAPPGSTADPDRGWEAVVIGEYERAFYGSQYAAMARPPYEYRLADAGPPEQGTRRLGKAGPPAGS